MSLFSRCALLVAALLSADLALAETYIFRSNNDTPSGNPSICSGDWDRSGSVFTCSGSISLAAGDVLRVRTTGGEWLTDITVVAAANLRLISNTVGTSAKNISLQTSYGTLTATGSNSIFGSVVSSSGAIDLAGATITGSVTGGSSAVRLSGGSVAGSVLTGGNITTDGTTISGSLTSNSGTVSLTGGSVTGQVRSGCCGVTTNGTDLLGGARSDSSSISITGGTLQGDFFANNNTATFTGVTMTAGTVSGASSVTFNNSMLGSTSENVTVTSVSGPVNLNNTVAYGDFTAPNYSTIFVNSPSTVTGTCLPNSTPANACRPGAVLSWSLDETAWSGAAGEVLDASGNNLNGTVINGAVTAGTTPALPQVNAQGTCGYGGFTASSSQYVQRADNNLLDLQGSFTIGLWVKPRTLPASGLMSILSKDENYEFHLNPNGTINWWWQTTGPSATREFNSTQALAVGQWSHVLIRHAPGDQRIYINGALAGQATFSGTPVINGDPLQLGADQGTAGRYFNGELDELRLYNTALSQAQISALVAERHQCSLALQCFNDNFNDGSLGDDWAVASRGATAFTPSVSAQRMRLTSNQGNVSTSSTLQRLFPAAGNYIQVQFRYYAYNGSGADGVAVVFSDANVTPQPGAFGGPLGYGSRGDAANPGFAGGWLGIGIDEYGNFSNEGGPGGPGPRADSVAVRGSGENGWIGGYRYIAGTGAGLNPGVDSASSTSAAPGHLYRITLDGRFGNEARVTVERDSGSGFVVLPNLSAVNVLAAAYSQSALPTDFYLSLTGSTGGSTNIHELDDLQVCATNINPIGRQVDHFELVYDTATPLTCNPLPVTVRACANASCTQLYTDPVSVPLIPSSGWVGGMPGTFSGGQATFNLQVTAPGTVTLGVGEGAVPPAKPNSQTVCSTSNCQVEFVDSGFFFTIPTQLANKESGLVTLTARRRNPDTQKCEPSFRGVTRNVAFWTEYLNPGPAEILGEPKLALRYNALSTTPQTVSTSSTSATTVPLEFDANAQAKIWVRYPDAGRLQLNASHFSDEGYAVGSASFVSKPYGLCLSTASACGSPNANCAVFPGGIRAGDAFPLTIRAVGWESDDEASTAQALCSGNITTPNFRHSGITLSSAVQAPAGGEPGDVTPDSYDHALGNQTEVDVAISEVGVFNLSATPVATYFGETVGGGSRDLVGRFIPAYLGVVGDASLTPSCGSAFSYQGQPMDFASDREPSLTITAYNRAGVVTTNYDRGAFWKLAAPGVGSYSSITGVAGRDARLASDGTAVLEVAGADDGDGARTYSWTGEQLLYQPALLPGSDDYPFTAKVRQSFSAASLQETDQGQVVCYATGTDCIGYSYDFADDPGSEVRLGRLWIGNAHGSELSGLSLPVRLESWQSTAGGSFQPEGLDTCTTASVLGAPVLGDYSGGLAEGETAASLNWPLTVNDRSVSLTAPGSGNAGSVTVSFPLAPAWLQYPWNGVSRSAAKGLASFGIYKGAAPLIFRRELYR